jgi:hypothetical protein
MRTPVSAALIALVTLLSAAPAIAAGESECRTYATNAVLAFVQANNVRCNIPPSPRWHDNGENHYNWCRAAPDSWLIHESNMRTASILLCQRRSNALECEQYARRAVEQTAAAKAINCHTDHTPRWTATYEHHLGWCLFHSGGLAQIETSARDFAIRQCQQAANPPQQSPAAGRCVADCQACSADGLRCSLNSDCSWKNASAPWICY